MENNDFQIGSEEEGSSAKQETRPGAILVLILAVVGGGGYLFYKHGPAKASAATPVAVDTSAAQNSIAEFLQVKGGDVSSIQKGLSNTERVVKQFNSYASMTQIPLGDLSSNPFRVDARATTTDPATGAPIPAAPAAPVPDEVSRAEQRKKATEAAAQLKIESIVIGRKGGASSALINGEFVRIGDKVEGFKVESIKPGVVILSDGQYHFERRLNQ